MEEQQQIEKWYIKIVYRFHMTHVTLQGEWREWPIELRRDWLGENGLVG